MKSMTAFARSQCNADWGQITWEVRSVNHRYLETHFRLPDNWRELEMPLRERIKQHVARGKLELTLTLQLNGEAARPEVDGEVLTGLIQAMQTVRLELPTASEVNIMDVLQWPGLIREPALDRDSMAETLLACADDALNQLVQARAREGEALRRLIEARLNEIERIVSELRPIVPEAVRAYEAKLRERLAQLKAEVDENRLAQEVAMMAQKLDVAEELDRLLTNVRHVREALEQDGPAGRRLDFLMQELNREANTLGSKAADMRLTEAAVELKVLIEQMREQVQNIE